tara:strand:- start:21786 stop:22853 length:1068 start_codon:yes stop_codon:yes gene_type:complete
MIYKKKNILSKEIKSTFIYQEQTIKEALRTLTSSGYKMCIVLDRKNHFKGVLNDGDIRRGLLKGKTLSSGIKDIYNKKPIIFRENSDQIKVFKKLAIENVNHAPIVKNKKIIGIFPSKKNITQNLKIPVVIMCGGFGKRLKPVTLKIPKALVLVNNTPMLTKVINNLKKYGFKKFILSTYYKSKLIRDYYKSGISHNIEINYLKEKKPLGTAGSLSLLKNTINEKNLLLTNCDVISEINYKSLLDFHIENKADFTMAIKKYYSKSKFGEIDVRGIYVKNIIEKPTKDVVINAGIYVMKSKLINELKFNEHKNMDQFIKLLIKKNKKVIAFPFYDNWFDLGTKSQIKIFKKTLRVS